VGRVSTKNHMRTPEEKEEIVLEYLNGRAGCREVANAYGISKGLFCTWIKKYRESGIEGITIKDQLIRSTIKPHFSSNLKWGSRCFF